MPPPAFPSVTIQEGAIARLGGLLTLLKVRRLFLVIDKPAYEFSGAARALEGCLDNREVTFFSDFALNPKLEDAERGVALFRDARPDAVVALGGGSAIDMGKLIATCGVQDRKSIDYIKAERPLENDPPPLIAIPTTSGTGSEATHFAVVYIEGQKHSFAHPLLLPNFVFIDPELTYSLPRKVTACSGLDALCQSAESIWAVGATEESVGYAVEGLRLALDHLEQAVTNPTPESRLAMAEAAHLSGKAINISKTTAPHAFSYAVTTRYAVPHGAAVALTLGAFLKFNGEINDANCTDPRGATSVKARIDQVVQVMGNGSADQAQARLRSLIKRIECPGTLSEIGVKQEDLPWLIEQVNVERLSNNPRRISAFELSSLLKSLF